LILWDVSTWQVNRTVPDLGLAASAVVFSPKGGQTLAIGVARGIPEKAEGEIQLRPLAELLKDH
jgi:hypothetical protein